MRPEGEYREAVRLIKSGMNDSAVGRALGIPRGTVRDWRYGIESGSGGRTRSFTGRRPHPGTSRLPGDPMWHSWTPLSVRRSDRYHYGSSRSGEILGKRDGLKHHWGKPLAGSNPASGTIGFCRVSDPLSSRTREGAMSVGMRHSPRIFALVAVLALSVVVSACAGPGFALPTPAPGPPTAETPHPSLISPLSLVALLRQPHPDRGALAHLRFHGHVPTHTLHQSLHDGQTQPAPLFTDQPLASYVVPVEDVG